jgi:multidrug efflux pump subunit AcrB
MIRFFEFLRVQRRAILLGPGALAAIGVAASFRLPAAILPEVTFPRITVIAESGERPAEEMVRAVTRPLEETIRRVPGIREVRSTTSRGSVEINLDCAWRSDMDITLQRIQAQIDAERTHLPDGTSVDARIMNPALFPVLGFSLTSKTRSLAELRDFAVTTLQPELARLPGAADVVVQGGRRLEARVTLDPARLEARGLDAETVAQTLRSSTELHSVGLLDANRRLYLGLADARPPDLAALEAIPIPVENAPPVPLGLLGHISLEEAPEFVRYAAQSREAVLVNILRQSTRSTIGLADAAHRWFVEHRDLVPADVTVQTFYDQSELVRSSVRSVRDSLLVGGLLAILIVTIFLRSVRLGLLGALVLPGSIALTLFGFAMTRQSLNLMTLGGIAAALGLVLDDAIVVVEHLAHAASSPDRYEGVSVAMAEIAPTLAGSSLCTIAIFLPFMFLGGVAGAFFRVLALSMTLMLGSSFLFCLMIVPLFSRLSSRSAPVRGRAQDRFARAVGAAIRHPARVGLGLVLLLGLMVVSQKTLGTGFLPEMDEGSLILDFIAPPGTSLTETVRMLEPVEREIDRTPEIEAWSRRTGDQLGFFITEPNVGDYVLKLRAHRRRDAEAIADDLRQRIQSVEPAIEIEFGQLIEDVIGDLTTNPQPIEVRVFGEDRHLTETKAREATAILESVRGVVDAKDGVVVGGPNVSIVPGTVAARAGLDAEKLGQAVQASVSGIDAGQILRGIRTWPVRVVVARPEGTLGARGLAEVRVPMTPSRWAPLSELASLRVDPGETEVNRDDLRNMVSVTARLSGRDLGSAITEIQAQFRRRLVLPPGMLLRYGGLWAEQQSSFLGLAMVLLGATVAVLFILIAFFPSWRQVAAVLLVVLTSLLGVSLGLHLTQVTFNILSFVGAIMVVGIVAENAFFLVANYRRRREQGEAPRRAALLAAERRARPVLMTTAAGVAALLPLALGLGQGADLLRPLAIAVIGGFVTSAPLLLLALPSLLAAGEASPVESESDS